MKRFAGMLMSCGAPPFGLSCRTSSGLKGKSFCFDYK